MKRVTGRNTDFKANIITALRFLNDYVCLISYECPDISEWWCIHVHIHRNNGKQGCLTILRILKILLQSRHRCFVSSKSENTETRSSARFPIVQYLERLRRCLNVETKRPTPRSSLPALSPSSLSLRL